MSYDRFIRMLESSDSAEMTEEECRKWLEDPKHSFGMSGDDVKSICKLIFEQFGREKVRLACWILVVCWV